MSTHQITFQLNGFPRKATVPAERLLIDLLRDECGLTGTKEGCSVGVCGACSVIVDGKLTSACLVPAVFIDGAAVRTIEGLAQADGTLTPLQRTFIEEGGFQCGICTPGQIIAATSLLEEYPKPTEEQLREWMMGNLCRCTGYEGIRRAIRAVAPSA